MVATKSVQPLGERPISSGTMMELGRWTRINHHRVFPHRDDALDCARELAGDPDLPPLSQI
jgi:hypothetical protein